MSFELLLLKNSHNRKEFDCGKELLNNYIKQQAKQDVKKKLSVCFVLIDKSNDVKGYYTLSNSSIPQIDIPEEISRKLPDSYSNIPVTLLGRLAIDKSIFMQGQGEYLLMDALKESYIVSKNVIGSIAVIVDPLDDEAISFYEKYDFILLPNSGKMFLSMKIISKLFPNI